MEEEDDSRHTSGKQHGIVVLIDAFVANTPPYPDGMQLVDCAWELNSGLRKTPSYVTGVHMSVEDDADVSLPEGRVDEGHGVQETSRG